MWKITLTTRQVNELKFRETAGQTERQIAVLEQNKHTGPVIQR